MRPISGRQSPVRDNTHNGPERIPFNDEPNHLNEGDEGDEDFDDLQRESHTWSSKKMYFLWSGGGSINERIYFRLILLLGFATTGFLLMVATNEEVISNNGESTPKRTLLKFVLAMTTFLAEYNLYKYYKLLIEKYIVIDSDMTDIQIPWNFKLSYIFESVIIGIQPVPFMDGKVTVYGITNGEVTYDWDNVLGVAMILRLYLIYRMFKYVLGYHMRKAKVLGSLNKVPITSSFSFKSFLHINPYQFLLTALLLNILVIGYGVRLCEYNLPDTPHKHFSETVWYMFITISTIGFGDITVRTYCARSMAILGGSWGVLLTALLINFIDRTLLLTYPQTRMVNLIGKNKRRENLKIKSIVLIQRLWRYRKNKGVGLLSQFKVINAIHEWKSAHQSYKRFRQISEITQVDPTTEQLFSEIQALNADMYRIQGKLRKVESFARRHGGLQHRSGLYTTDFSDTLSHIDVVSSVEEASGALQDTGCSTVYRQNTD